MISNSKVYAFTNENLSSFAKIYDFSNSRVLASLASGDQYFSCTLFGSRKVEVYDSNPNTWPFFVLKYYAILILSYEEFRELYTNTSKNNLTILEKILPYLPVDVLCALKMFLTNKHGLSKYLMYSPLSHHERNYTSDIIIPYFEEEKYYSLQALLRNSHLPQFYLKDFLELPDYCDKPYDILLTSNIFKWLNISPLEYDNLLSSFDIPYIQAHYLWHEDASTLKSFAHLGYKVAIVPHPSPLTITKNFVISKISHH